MIPRSAFRGGATHDALRRSSSAGSTFSCGFQDKARKRLPQIPNIVRGVKVRQEMGIIERYGDGEALAADSYRVALLDERQRSADLSLRSNVTCIQWDQGTFPLCTFIARRAERTREQKRSMVVPIMMPCVAPEKRPSVICSS